MGIAKKELERCEPARGYRARDKEKRDSQETQKLSPIVCSALNLAMGGGRLDWSTQKHRVGSPMLLARTLGLTEHQACRWCSVNGYGGQ